MRNSSSLDWLRFMHTPNDYRVSPNSFKTYYSSLKRCTLHQFWTFLVDNWNKIARLTRFLLLFLHRVRKRCAFEKESLFNNYK